MANISHQSQSRHYRGSVRLARGRSLQRLSLLLAGFGAVLMLSIAVLAAYLLLFDYKGDADGRSRASMQAVFTIMDNSTPDARPELADVLSRTLLAVDYIAVDEPVPDSSRPRLAAAVIELLTIQLDADTRTQFALSDGHLIQIGSQALTGDARPSLWITLSLLAILLMIALSLWAATRYLSPVQRDVDAADQLSLEQELTPLDDQIGPALARDAAKSFNRMQARIQAYLNERSLMIHALHHDMRHGLFKLQMRLEQLEDEALRTKSARNINDLLEVLEDILAFADTDVGPDRRQNIRANAMIMNAAEPYLDQGRSISMDLIGPHTVSANQTRLKRIFSNIIDNAMAYADQLWISSQTQDDYYEIVLDDNGPGIPTEERDRMLQPFERLDGSRNRDSGGTGLGLAIVKRAIERDKGTLTLTDSPRGGLRVVLRLPRPE